VAITLRNSNQVRWTLRNDVSQGDDFQILRSTSSTPVLDIGHNNGTMTVDAAIIPNATYNLGSSSRRWGVVYALAVDAPSDRRLKEEIADLDHGLDEVLALRPVHYVWKEHPEMGKQLGLIAQELRAVIPEVVHEADDEAGSLSVEYMALIPVLVKALQEQQALIEEQRDQLAARTAGLAALDARVAALEGRSAATLTAAP
jgi:hypothetical protein